MFKKHTNRNLFQGRLTRFHTHERETQKQINLFEVCDGIHGEYVDINDAHLRKPSLLHKGGWLGWKDNRLTDLITCCFLTAEAK